jgi:hypothetical protein
MSRTPEYRIWASMIARATNINTLRDPASAVRYIERGVCDRWNPAKGGSFENFYADMGPRPSNKHTIERYDNDGPYAPWNCGWETRRVQARNRSSNHWVTYNGKRVILTDAAELSGLNKRTILGRIRKGWPETDWFIAPNSRRH